MIVIFLRDLFTSLKKRDVTMINIAICDDEQVILDRIKKLVTDFFHNQNIEIKIFLFLSGEELLSSDKDIDILFLDIQMRQLNGIETARKMRNKSYKGFEIFITVLKEMVFDSFEVQPFDYLLKPVKYDSFKKTMERLLLSMKRADKENLLIQRGTESSIVSFDEIIFCEIINRKVYLHFKSEDVIDYYDKIENLEKKLDHRFFRCHRSYLINMQYLISYKDGFAYMVENHEIPVSRLRKKEFSNVILQYMKEWRF